MDLEQYLEKDIIIFLDGKIERKENVLIDREEEYGIYMARDYLKELSYALDNEELTKAKRLFDDLKQKFSLLPKNSLERKKVYSLLEKMYSKIQNYVKIKEGKIEVIKQGDSEVFKDTTEKFYDITNKIITNKIEVSPEFVKEFENEKHADLPISTEKDRKSREQAKSEDIEDKKRKHEHDDASVESKILGKQIGKYNKEHEEKDTESKQQDELLYQDMFGKKKTEAELNRLQKEEQLGEHLTKKELSLETEMVDVAEKLVYELNKKLEEKNIESIRREISRQVMEELDKRFDAEKHAFSTEKEKMFKDILDQVYRKAKHIISDEDNRIKNISENMIRNDFDKEKHVMTSIIKKEDNKIDDIKIDIDKLEDNKIKYIDVNIDKKEGNKSDDINVYFNKIEENKAARMKYISPNIKNPEHHRAEKEDFTEISEDATRHIRNPQKFGNRHKFNDENLRMMYEEAIYTMFQNEYSKAAKLFERILRIRPENMAARIRLYECAEAIGNA